MSEYRGYPLCSICGGIKGSIPIPYPRDIGICPGHEPAPKHDGKLDEKGEYTVELWKQDGRATVDIEENVAAWIKDHPNCVELTPKQALSLLEWLRQEEAELHRLATKDE